MELNEAQKECVDNFLRAIDIKSLLENDPQEFEGCDWDEAWEGIVDYLNKRRGYK
jgi:hypothetical protein